jgi:hypothetical protein
MRDKKKSTGAKRVSSRITQRAARIKLFLCDVDGVLTDGAIRCGLKARNRIAQGNALGSTRPMRLHPERVRQNPRRAVVPPFQGCHVSALSAHTNARTETNGNTRHLPTRGHLPFNVGR